MTHARRVAKNSLWLILQPLILNVISIYAISYIARTLGKGDYGKFTFAFTYVSLFMAMINLGLGSLAAREIAEAKESAGVYVSKLVVVRIFFALFACALVAISVNIFHYPSDTRTIIYIAASTLLFYAVTVTYNSVFQGFEKMRYIAYVQFISGLALTLLSILVLYLGYGIIGLTVVYCFGSFLGTLISIWYMIKMGIVPRAVMDLAFWKSALAKGMPFFIPGLVLTFGTKLGIIILGMYSGDSAVGIYGAAYNLVDKLVMIPDGICTAIFPAMAVLYRDSREEAAGLYRKYYHFLFIIGLPIAVGTTILSRPVIALMYGPEYAPAALVLQILSWWLFLTFLVSLQNWTLGAMHFEKKSAMAFYVSTSFYVVANLLLIPRFNEVGVGIASLAANMITFLFLTRLVRKHLLHKEMERRILMKTLAANVVMGVCVYWVNTVSFPAAVVVGIAVYSLCAFGFQIVGKEELTFISAFFNRKKSALTA